MRREVLVEVFVCPVVGQVEDEEVAARGPKVAGVLSLSPALAAVLGLTAPVVVPVVALSALAALALATSVIFAASPRLLPLHIAGKASVFPAAEPSADAVPCVAGALNDGRGRRLGRIKLRGPLPLTQAGLRVVIILRAVRICVLSPETLHRGCGALPTPSSIRPHALAEATTVSISTEPRRLKVWRVAAQSRPFSGSAATTLLSAGAFPGAPSGPTSGTLLALFPGHPLPLLIAAAILSVGPGGVALALSSLALTAPIAVLAPTLLLSRSPRYILATFRALAAL
mmetsp:Transcript_126370/g.282384  ORF Transcript_126370/g.282384 Transcript_126370/m.282384 type:complete len:285 (-) Transcript_126370:155-1009(-)